MTAAKLRELRGLVRLTQREMAEAIGVSRERYAKWEQEGSAVPSRFVELVERVASRYEIESDDYLRIRATRGQLSVLLLVLRDCSQDASMRETAYQELVRILGLA